MSQKSGAALRNRPRRTSCRNVAPIVREPVKCEKPCGPQSDMLLLLAGAIIQIADYRERSRPLCSWESADCARRIGASAWHNLGRGGTLVQVTQPQIVNAQL